MPDMRFAALLSAVAHAVYTKTVFWVADIIMRRILSRIRAALRATMLRCRPYLTKTGTRLQRAIYLVRNMRDLSLVDLRTGEIIVGAG